MVSYGSGRQFRDMFAAATTWLGENVASINAMNVFPVPDGDTGTNMLLTMNATMEEARQTADDKVSTVAKAMAWGALMGARGNSGVILSQIFRGMALELEDKDTLSGKDFASAMVQASSYAYKAVSKPVEGTILTVVRDASTAAQDKADAENCDLPAILETVVKAAEASVARTPNLLPILRETGVVDAGGQGLYILLEGALRFLRGEEITSPKAAVEEERLPLEPEMAALGEHQYGYCTEFLIQGQALDLLKVREKITDMGESTLVVGDESTIRVHVHTFDPGGTLSYATSMGTLHQVRIQNIDEQHQEFRASRKALARLNVAVVVVALGEGIHKVFKSLGVSSVVSGGQTMNPSTQELLKAVEAAPSDKIILLPNDKNVILAAHQVENLTTKKVSVVPTTTVPQGIAATLAFNSEASHDENVAAMEKALSTVRTLEVCIAVRSTEINGLKITKGQTLGLLDGQPVVAGDERVDVIHQLFSHLEVGQDSLITIYYGACVKQAEGEKVAQSLRSRFPKGEVELIEGSQPHYNYIISVE